MRVLVLVLVAVGLASSEAPRVLVLLADGFNRTEHYVGVAPLYALGYHVVVASPNGAVVRVDREGKADTQGRDVDAQLAVAAVGDIEAYHGLYIPGGFSPGVLERDPEVLRIVRDMVDAGKPVAAVCHGPRLLLRAGRLHDKVWTGLWAVANELPDPWLSPARGAYLDRSVIRDGQLVTGRFPNDMAPFARAMIERFAAAGGPGLPAGSAKVAILAPGWSSHERWYLQTGLELIGHQVLVAVDAGQIAGATFEASQLVAILPARVGVEASLLTVVSEAVARAQTVAATVLNSDQAPWSEVPTALAGLGAAAAALAQPLPVSAPPPFSAALALRPGFDDAVVAALLTQTRVLGHRIVILADQPGWLRGANGLPIEAELSYADAEQMLSGQALIIAPGGHFPEYRPDARQGEGAAWLPEQGERDARRRAWLLARWQAGATLVTVGYDSLALGREEPLLAGVRLSTSPQLQWSFGRGGARYDAAPAQTSTERLLSCAGFDALPALLPLLPRP